MHTEQILGRETSIRLPDPPDPAPAYFNQELDYGEEACAVIRRRAGAALEPAELQDFLRARVSHQKVPRHVLFVNSFPVTGSGKIRKRDVAARARVSLS
jgi:acyl-CoA synthetase (AMP-forming)/AMP-acid ligase II